MKRRVHGEEKVKVPEEFWKLASANCVYSKACWAHTQTSEYGRKKIIISVDSDEALVIIWALEDYINKHRKEYE